MKTDSDPKRYCKSLTKGLSLLQLFTSESPELSASQIVVQLELHKTTTYRMLAAFCEQGFLVRSEVSGKYSIGPALYILGSLYQYTNDLQKAGGPVIKLINELTCECTNLGTLSGTDVVYMLREESKHEFRWSRPIGSTMPAHASALGKALLSALSDSEVDERFPNEALPVLTKNTVATRTDLKRELQEIRQSGVSFDPEGCIPMVFGLGSAVSNHHRHTVAAISISVPVFRLDDTKREFLVKLLHMAARLVSYRLGCRDQDIPIHTLDQLRAWWEQAQIPPADARASPLPNDAPVRINSELGDG